MEYKEAREIVNSIEKLSQLLSIEFDELAGRLCFLDAASKEKINAAVEKHNALVDMSFAERARAFGYEVVEEGNKTVVSTEL